MVEVDQQHGVGGGGGLMAKRDCKKQVCLVSDSSLPVFNSCIRISFGVPQRYI